MRPHSLIHRDRRPRSWLRAGPPLAVAACLLLPAASQAATFTVASTADGGPGSLRQAILDANAAPSPPHRVVFALPESDPGFDGTVFTIRPASGLPVIRDGVRIDATTQTTFGGDTNGAGPEVVLNGAGAGAAAGIVISGDGSAVSGLVVNGFSSVGVVIGYNPDSTPSGNRISRNYIGTNPRGTAAVPNEYGLDIHGYGSPGAEARDNVIADNLIAGNRQYGMVFCDTLRTTVVDNLIGTTRTGLGALGNGAQGLYLLCAGDVDSTIEDNTIAFNGADGFFDTPDYRYSATLHDRNALRRNAIHSNRGLGINLNPPPFDVFDGPTPNDHCDADAGGNTLQNYPVLTSVSLAGAGTTIQGTLDSVPSQSYVVELYSSDKADPSGFGEGQRYIGSTSVATGAGCTGSFGVTVATDVLNGQVVSATATDATGSTSEFGRTIAAVSCDATGAITGTAANETLVGTAGNDVICGLGGNDVLKGMGGNDILLGGDGIDTLDGGAGADAMNGDGGIDTATYAARTVAVDVSLDGAPGDGQSGEGDNVRPDVEYVLGGSANDTLTGSDAINVLTGNNGSDAISGGPGNDALRGGNGDDALHGGDGSDALDGGLGADELVGDAGIDKADYVSRTTPVTVSLDGDDNDGEAGEADNAQVENVVGGAGPDVIRGDAAANTLTGNGGADTITGALGKDTLNGNDGDDTLVSSDGISGDRDNCGAGADTTFADAADIVAADCETDGAANIALNTSASGLPSPLESDPGWGGGSYPWDLTDGRHSYDIWTHGLAFTGGRSSWAGQPCGPRQATIAFPAAKRFGKVVVWHHGAQHVPATAHVDYWDGSAWNEVSFARRYGEFSEDGTNSGNATSDEYTFAAVTGSKVRWRIDNCQGTLDGSGQLEHGWLYEFEVFAAPPGP